MALERDKVNGIIQQKNIDSSEKFETKKMGKELKSGKMDFATLENLKMVSITAKELQDFLMAVCMLVSTKMTIELARVFTWGQMVYLTMDNT